MDYKEKLAAVRDRTRAIFEKAGKKTVIAICAVLLIGTAVLLNFILRDEPATDGVLKKQTDLGNLSSVVSDGDKNEEYFATLALNRKNARGEAVDVLSKVVESSTAVDEMKAQAAADIEQIAKDIETEANIETLILSKGFEKCIAVISGDTASIIVESDGLLPNELAQIKEIVYEQAGILPSNLKIVER